jgi:hypothetical protein
MNLRSTLRILPAALCFAALSATPAQADILISLDQGSLQPDENILFNCNGLLNDATTIQGCTNQTQTLVDISSDVALHGTGGQASVEALDEDAGFSLAFIRLNDTTQGFGEFEADITMFADSPTTATIEACNQFGSFGNTAPYTPSGPFGDGLACESLTYNLGVGENFFVVSVADAQLLRGVRITTGSAIFNIEQIRIGDFADLPDNVVLPEPASMLLYGMALLSAGAASRKRFRSRQ